MFKSCSNLLGLNTRVAHFVPNLARSCTFCTVLNRVNAPDETFVHIFFDCQTTSNWLRSLELQFFNDIPLTSVNERKKFWFYGLLPNNHFDPFILLAIWCIKFVIWENKLRKKIPSLNSLKVEFFVKMQKMLSVSSKVRNVRDVSDFLLCRNWGNLVR